MKIAVVGAGGFVGNLLVCALSKEKNDEIVAISLNPKKISCSAINVKKQKCDVMNTAKLGLLLEGCECVYYLVHMMSGGAKDFLTLEINAVDSFIIAAKKAKTKKVIYLGGLGNEKQKLSMHLKSRHKTGQILRDDFNNVIEFRASIIIGKGSASTEIIRQLVDKISFMILPGWANTLTQPICAKDVIRYLVQAKDSSYVGNKIYEIGGPQTYMYKELMKLYAMYKAKRLNIVVIKFLPSWPAKLFIGFFINNNIKNTAISMIDSLESQVIVTNNYAKTDFKNIEPQQIDFAQS
jgi:uncharacterized protein YbjT (DUF2867 family)